MLVRAEDGEGSLLLIQGPAGVGKTDLLDRTCAAARSRSFNVLTARGHPLERGFPYGVVRQLLEPSLLSASQRSSELLEGSASMAMSVLPGAGTRRKLDVPLDEQLQGVSYSALHGLYWFCSNLAERAPALLAVDDAQWADIPSQRFLLYLARRLEKVPVVILLTQREGEGTSEVLEELASEPAAEILRPKPLGREAVATLVERWLGAPAARTFASASHDATGGNPFLLRELLLGLKERGLEPTAENTQHISQLRLPAVSRSVMRRLRQLPPAANELARALAVLGSGASLHEAADLAGMSRAAAAEAVDRLVALHILKPGAIPDFIHPLVRAAVYEDLPSANRRLQHGRAARLLAERSAPADRIAAHTLESEPLGDHGSVEMLRQAARQALARGVPGSAVAYLRRALSEPPSESQRCEVLFELGEAEAGVDPPAAVQHLNEAFELSAETQRRASICLTLLRAQLQVGRVEEAVGKVKACIAALDASQSELALLLEAELISALRQGVAASPLADESIERWRGRITGKTPSERLMLTHLAAYTALQGGDAAAVATMAEQALGEGRLLSDQTSGSFLYYLPIFQLICADRFRSAEAHLDQAARDARVRGSPLGFAMVSTIRSCLAYARGDLPEAEAESKRAAGDGYRLGWAYGFPSQLAVLLFALADQGSFDQAEEALSNYGMAGALPDTVSSRLLLGARADLRLAAGRSQQALADFGELRRREERFGPSNLFLIPYRPRAALALNSIGKHAEACRLIDESLAAARTWGAPRILGMTLRDAAAIRGELRLELLREAVTVTEAGEARLVRAQCLVDYGSALRRAGKRSDASAALRTGLDLAYRCHANVCVQQARGELAVLGARPRRPAISGVDALTASERRVARMAAEGLSNRAIAQALFVTNRTVELHLTHAYQKLGIASRDDLPEAIGAGRS